MQRQQLTVSVIGQGEGGGVTAMASPDGPEEVIGWWRAASSSIFFGLQSSIFCDCEEFWGNCKTAQNYFMRGFSPLMCQYQ